MLDKYSTFTLFLYVWFIDRQIGRHLGLYFTRNWIKTNFQLPLGSLRYLWTSPIANYAFSARLSFRFRRLFRFLLWHVIARGHDSFTRVNLLTPFTAFPFSLFVKWFFPFNWKARDDDYFEATELPHVTFTTVIRIVALSVVTLCCDCYCCSCD